MVFTLAISVRVSNSKGGPNLSLLPEKQLQGLIVWFYIISTNNMQQ